MFIGEFNTPELGYLLLGICVNSGKDLINDETLSILKRDLCDCKPQSLMHSYTFKEFKQLLLYYENKQFDLTLKEIIPNDYGIGLVRNVGFPKSTVEDLLKTVIAKFRYYAFATDVSTNSTSILTFNPDIKTSEKVKIKLSEGLVVRCTTIQTGVDLNIQKRNFEVFKRSDNEKGTLLVYDIKSEELESRLCGV